MKVFLAGRDKVGWALDADWKSTGVFLTDIGHTLTPSFLSADVVHAVSWNALLDISLYPLRWKKIIAVATNEIDTSSPKFLKAKNFVKLWIAPSRKMCEKLEQASVDVRYQPFYTDEKVFHKIDKSGEEIARELEIDYKLLEGRLVIGSFQRDSLGLDLSQPKWQKAPEVLIEILSKVSGARLLLLAGPRRHWIINQCRESGVPYFYYGKEPEKLEDDIYRNTLNLQIINKLYNLTDLYIVSSKSEGGPKSVLECAFTETMILSTGVGFAPDFLDPWCIYGTVKEALQKIEEIVEGKDVSKFIRFNYEKAYSIASYEHMRDRWRETYQYFDEMYCV